MEEKEAEKAEEKADRNKAEQLLDEKIAASKDGMIYLYDTDMKTIMEALKEDGADDKAGVKEQAAVVGANVDLKV